MKAIAGHAGLGPLANYLTRGGRQLLFDSLNVMEYENGMRWDKVMDETRALSRNDWCDAQTGCRTRTYNHYIVSLDPRDKVGLREFSCFVRDWAERWFDGEIGNFEVAIVYHNDNAERASRGEKGILHAHVVVNNTDLMTGRRLAPLLTKGVIQEMRRDLELRALAEGWHAFSEDGRSMTAAEMEAAGVAPTRTRGGAIGRLIERERESAAAIFAESYPDGVGGEGDPVAATGSIDEDARLSERIAAGVRDPRSRHERGERAPADFATGHQATRRGMQERGHERRRGWSWKGDVRDRVDMAERLANNMKEFHEVLKTAGVEVSYARDGEIKYSDAMGLGRTVRGTTLGNDYTEMGVRAKLMEKQTSLRRGAPAPGSGATLRPNERVAVARAVGLARAGSSDGVAEIGALRALVEYAERNGIHSYDGFETAGSGAAMSALAREIRMFDELIGDAKDELGIVEELERRRVERAMRGEGGTESAGQATQQQRPEPEEDHGSGITQVR